MVGTGLIQKLAHSLLNRSPVRRPYGKLTISIGPTNRVATYVQQRKSSSGATLELRGNDGIFDTLADRPHTAADRGGY
jgi:hypothetical protein